MRNGSRSHTRSLARAHSAEDQYQQKIEKYSAEIAATKKRCSSISVCRLLFFLLTVAFALVLNSDNVNRSLVAAVSALILSATAFIICFIIHSELKSKLAKYRMRCDLYRHRIAAMNHRFSELDFAVLPRPKDSDLTATTRDLNLIGSDSLSQLISVAQTYTGAKTLDNWLTTLAGREEVIERQQAAKELAPLVDLREELIIAARIIREERSNNYKSSNGYTPTFGLYAPGIYLPLMLSAINIIAIILVLFFNAPVILFILSAIVTCLFSVYSMKRCGAVFDELRSKAADAALQNKIYGLLLGKDLAALKLRQLVKHLNDVAPANRKLLTLVSLINLRRSSLYPFLQLFLCWDFMILNRALRWKGQWDHQFDLGVNSSGELEALLSLAGLAFENPEWCFPLMKDNADNLIFSAIALGHPLLPKEARVANDITMERGSPLVTFTGSNMSGKSTFLRAIGVNISLALAGGPVCAKSFALSNVRVATSMRVSDSLVKGNSLYLAELLQLKEIMNLARQSAGEATVLFLFDEILHGTNSVERGSAIRHIIKQLLSLGAVGFISTHDLTLTAAAADWQPRNYHFTDNIVMRDGKPDIVFDYILRSGPAPTTNGLILLKMVGLA